MRYAIAFLLATMISIATWKPSHAADFECPEKIATIKNDLLSLAATKILKSLYLELGCQATFIELPGRRGIRDFNTRLVDGEVFRLKQAEKLYERPFVRSSAPLFILSNSLWLHPLDKDDDRKPIGYLLGVVWQENYMKTREGKAYHDSAKLVEAYNAGRLRGFLFADFSLENLIRRKALSPPPVRSKVLLEAPLYHYLLKELTPFMDRFSELLKRDPFRNISEVIGEN